MRILIDDTILELVQGDITRENVEAIVNAANPGLSGGGGVDGAIHRAGGPRVLEECRRIVRIATGEAIITTGGDLEARYIIHAVGPIYSAQDKDGELLYRAYFNALQVAVDNGLHSVAFPSISTGAYRYPVDEAANIALMSVIDFLEKKQHQLTLVRFVLFDVKTMAAYESALNYFKKIITTTK